MWSKIITALMTLMPEATVAQPPGSNAAQHKGVPAAIEQQVLAALAFYPELRNTRIDFRFRNDIRKSVMQAQPVFRTLLRGRQARRYRVNISTHLKLTSAWLPVLDIPDTVMVGWIGHELGHILDYETKTNAALVAFGCRYLLQPRFVQDAERVADTLAVNRGLGHHLIATKRFILDHAALPQAYKNKIARLYLSPDAILELVQQLENKQQPDIPE